MAAAPPLEFRDPLMAAEGGLRPFTVSIEEATRLSGLSRTTIYCHISSGQLRSKKLGKRRLIVLSSLEQLVGAGDA